MYVKCPSQEKFAGKVSVHLTQQYLTHQGDFGPWTSMFPLEGGINKIPSSTRSFFVAGAIFPSEARSTEGRQRDVGQEGHEWSIKETVLRSDKGEVRG